MHYACRICDYLGFMFSIFAVIDCYYMFVCVYHYRLLSLEGLFVWHDLLLCALCCMVASSRSGSASMGLPSKESESFVLAPFVQASPALVKRFRDPPAKHRNFCKNPPFRESV